MVENGDIIQVTDDKDKWYPCLLIVDEVKSWGVMAYMTIPNNSELEPNGNAYYRIENGKFEKVGSAVVVAE